MTTTTQSLDELAERLRNFIIVASAGQWWPNDAQARAILKYGEEAAALRTRASKETP